MHKQIIGLSITGLLSFNFLANAQTGTHSLGASVPFGFRTYSVGTDSKNTDAYYMAQFSWGFRKNLSENENTSFSLGTVTSLGGGLYQDIYGYTGFIYGGSLQLWADKNHGMGAVPEPTGNRGFHYGLGIGVSYAGVDGDPIDDESDGISLGPMARFGYRFGIYSPKKDEYKAMGFSIYYKHGLEGARWRTIGFQILADL